MLFSIQKKRAGGLSIAKHVQTLIVMFIILTMALATFNFPSTQATGEESSWTTIAPMPTARGGLGVAVFNGKIYAIGGLSGDLTVNNNEEYDPVTNQWSTKVPMPAARTGCAIAVYNNKLYVIGGTADNGYVANNEAYDPATNTWETKASMPTPRSDLSASVVNDKIYLIGGKKYSSNSPYFTETNVNEVYDPSNDSWTIETPIPTAVYGYASAMINGKIYIIGGSKASTQGSITYINSNQVYDTQTDNWSLSANLPAVAAYGVAATTENYMAPSRLYFIGGYFYDSFSAQTQVYNPSNNSWSNGAPMPTPRAYLGVAVVNDVLFAIGGFDGKNWLDTNEQYKPVGYGTVPPKVQITSPENKTYTEVTLDFSINRGAEWMSYSLDNQANVTIKRETKLFNLSQGTHNIVIYANDSSGNMGYSNTVTFSVDTLAPSIMIMLPQNQSYSSTDIQLIFNVNEAVSKLAYSLDGKDNITIIGNVTLPALSDGSHHLTVYATDLVGNSNSSTVYFEIATFPTITVVAVVASATIALATSYLFLKRRKQRVT